MADLPTDAVEAAAKAGRLATVREMHQPIVKTFYVDSDCLDQSCEHCRRATAEVQP